MDIREHFKKGNVKTVMLTLTNRCNLSCVYCYETEKDADEMSQETAFRIIEDEMQSNSEVDFIEFDLFGGEPFLNFSLIKNIVEYLKNGTWSKKWICFATTNGTLVNEDVKEWLTLNRDYIVCCVSLDGTPEMHNYNRSNSFSKIDLPFFAKMYPNQPAKMTVSPFSLSNLADGIIYLHKMGYKVAANLAYGIDWQDQNNTSVFETQLKRLIDFYLKNPDVPICKMLDLDISLIGKKVTNEFSMKKYCGAGTTMTAYDSTGKAYPCHMFMPISAGKTKSDASLGMLFKAEYNTSMLEEKCQDCVAKRVCPTCIGMNYRETGNLYIKDDNYCKLMKIQLKAISVLKYYQLQKNILKLDNEEKYALLQAIYAIQNEL